MRILGDDKIVKLLQSIQEWIYRAMYIFQLSSSSTKKDSQKPFLSTFALPIIATTAITASILFKYLKKSKETWPNKP